MALSASRGTTEYGAFVNDAKVLADNQQLDFLEFVDKHGTILFVAQWPRNLAAEPLPAAAPPKGAFLRQEELPDGAALDSAIRK
jgi:hypothetical protein